MRKRSVNRAVQVGVLAAMFGGGFLCGTLVQTRADAQLGEIGANAAKQAAGSVAGGALGSAADLGSAIVDMETHVSGLQKNLDTLKKVKAALGG